jgi:DNA-binding transcriptional regulator PaaX
LSLDSAQRLAVSYSAMKDRISAEEVLTLIYYGVDLFCFPTLRNWNESYEGWLYRHGLLRRIRHLEAQRMLARQGGRADWAVRLTESGRLAATGGRDPQARWRRPWDGWWRQFVFDLPVGEQAKRAVLLRWLRHNGFGYLQDSVWISPDPVGELAKVLKGMSEDAATFTVLECRCARGFSNAALVAAAWPFERIQQAYGTYQQFAHDAMKRLRGARLHPRDFFSLLRSEREHWQAAFSLDPLLPRPLWPKDYKGPQAWRTRGELLRLFAQRAV